MDSECPTASRIADQPTAESGANFTFTAMQSFKRGIRSPSASDSLGVLGEARGGVPSGLRPYRRPADGDGR
jgi:hypothetical protein